MDNLAACRAYLANLPPAISGSHGHDATFRAACWLVRHGLSDAEARVLLCSWNGTHCQPPWTERELAHKLSDARRVAGYAIRTAPPKPAVRVVWKVERKPPLQVPALPDAVAEAPPANGRSVQASDCTSIVLRPDERPWLAIARQILAGEFDGADRATVKSLAVGLRSIPHPLCQQALDRINPKRRATP